MSFASLVGMLIAIFSAAKLADDVFGSGLAAKKFGKFFRNSAGVPTFARAYVSATFLMDRIYGLRILSLRALFVSCLISVIWMCILMAAMVAAYGRAAWIFDAVFSRQVIINFWWFMFVGIVVDYISVSAARVLLSQSAGSGTVAKLAWLTFAAAGNSLVFFVLYCGAKSLYLSQPLGAPISHIMGWFEHGFSLHLVFKTLTDWQFFEVTPGVFDIQNGNSEVVYAFPEGMLYFSSLLTLIWLVLHILAHCLYFGGFNVSRLMNRLVAESALESRPLQSAATIVGVLVLLPIWVIVQLWHYSPVLLGYLH